MVKYTQPNVQDIAYSKLPTLLDEGINFELNYLSTELEFLYTKSSIIPQIKRVPTLSINPSQFFEQYINEKSEHEATEFQNFLSEQISIKDIRQEDFYPILVNIRNNTIIDGNHRHYALSKINSPYVVVLYVDVEEK